MLPWVLLQVLEKKKQTGNYLQTFLWDKKTKVIPIPKFTVDLFKDSFSSKEVLFVPIIKKLYGQKKTLTKQGESFLGPILS